MSDGDERGERRAGTCKNEETPHAPTLVPDALLVTPRPGDPSLVAQLVCQDRQRERPPSEIRLLDQPGEKRRGEREAGDTLLDRSKSVGEGTTPFGGVEVAGEDEHRGGIEAPLTVRITAGSEHEHRAPTSRTQL